MEVGMARSLNGEAWRVWRERLRRFAENRGRVAAFCEAEGVSVPSFYQWRKKLADCSATHGERHGARVPHGSRSNSGASTKPVETAFLPVQIAAASHGPVEIELPNGARIWLAAGDLQTLGAAIAAAGQAPASSATSGRRREEQPC